mgnify:CR=1 FL=1
MIALETIIEMVDMPVSIKAHTVPNEDGTFTIFINSRLNSEQQKEGYSHEIEHILKDDFKTKNVDKTEFITHANCEFCNRRNKIGLIGIINAYNAKCRTLYDMAEYLDVTEEALCKALEHYNSKYGICTTVDNYTIYFEPAIGVFERL